MRFLLFQCLCVILVLMVCCESEEHFLERNCLKNSKTRTVHRIRKNYGLIEGFEYRNLSGIVIRRVTNSLQSLKMYEDRNADGVFDKINLEKKFIGPFRFPDKEFDQYFSDEWRDGFSVMLLDDDYDGHFETKWISKVDNPGEEALHAKFFNETGKGEYVALKYIKNSYHFNNFGTIAAEFLRDKMVSPSCTYAASED